MAVSQSSLQFSYAYPTQYTKTSQYCAPKGADCKCVKRKTMSGVHLSQFKSMFLKRTFWTMGYSCYQTEKPSMWASPRKKSVKTLLKAQDSWTLWPNWSWEIKCVWASPFGPLGYLGRGAETDFRVAGKLRGPELHKRVDEVLPSASQYIFRKVPKHPQL